LTQTHHEKLTDVGKDGRDKDKEDDEKYLERLNVKEGDKEVSQPLRVYDTSNPDIEEENDGHIESSLERQKELEKANV